MVNGAQKIAMTLHCLFTVIHNDKVGKVCFMHGGARTAGHRNVSPESRASQSKQNETLRSRKSCEVQLFSSQ